MQLLRIPAFRNLWLGQAISQMGDALYYVAFMFMVKKITGQNNMVGFIGAVEVLPFFIFGPYTGVLADRLDRRVILLWSDLLCGFILVGLALMGLRGGFPPVWTLFVAAFLLSSVRAFFMPTKNATIPAIVPQDLLGRALAFSMGTQNFMQLGGLALSAAVLAPLYQQSPQVFFVSVVSLNALSYFLSAYFIYRLPSVKPERTDGDSRVSVRREFMEGLRYIIERKALLAMRIVGILFSLMVAPFFVVYIAANDQWFGGKPQTLSWFEFAFFLGMIIGSVLVGRRMPQRPGIANSVALGVVAVRIGLMAFSPHFWPFAFWNLVCGVAVPFADITRETYTQLVVPDAMRGRVNSLQMMTSTAMMPIGMAAAGALLDVAGLITMFLVMGGGMLLAAMIGLAFRDYRQAVIPKFEDAQSGGQPVSATA